MPKSIVPPSVRASRRTDEITRRESNNREPDEKKNLLILNNEISPRHVRSSLSTGITRMARSSINSSASATVFCAVTLTTRVCITSRTFGETSATKRGAGTPNVRRTKSMRSFVSPQRAATALSMPVRRLNSA